MTIPLIDTSRTVEVYCTLDPAIDGEASNIEEYGKTLDPRHIVLREGHSATRFEVRPLAPTRAQQLVSEMLSDDNIVRASNALSDKHFMEGVVAILDVRWRDIDYPRVDVKSELGREILAALPNRFRADISSHIRALGEGVPAPADEPAADLGN